MGPHYKVIMRVCYQKVGAIDRLSRVSGSRSRTSGNPKVAGSNPVSKPWSRQSNDFKTDTCDSLAWHSALLGYGKVWFAQGQDIVTECVSRSWCQQPGVPARQHY